jgi:hypothetical protein
MQHAITLRHRRTLFVPPGTDGVPIPIVATALKNLEGLGFTLSPALLARVQTLSVTAFLHLYDELLPVLRQLVGANVAYRPFYPNFPAQVMDAPAGELYLNALLHYLTLWRPDMPQHERPPLLERTDLTVIDLSEADDLRQIGRQLLAANASLSAQDRADVVWLLTAYCDRLDTLLPATIPQKETIALVASTLITLVPDPADWLARYVATATDVLRVAVALSGGDVSLAAPTKFRSFARPERRLLLGLLESCGNRAEDMQRYREPWKRLGERLHPGEYAQRFPQSAHAFDDLRSGRPVVTLRSRVEAAVRAGDVAAAVDLLVTRPGELARRLDHLLRCTTDPAPITRAFAQSAAQVATPVLLQALAHFRHRPAPPALRTFFPKGNVAKLQAVPNTLPPLAPTTCEAIAAICTRALIARFGALPPLGRVYLDERLRGYLVPFSQRSASKALRTIVRGSRLPIGAGSTIRFFLWWKEGLVDSTPTGRVDIDLSAVLYDATWGYKEHISYTNLRSARYRAAHSGDVVSAPDGACEFIDLDIDSVLAYGGRYVVMAINAYTSHTFADLPECFAGWMLRQAPRSGEIFEPRTVQDRIDLAAASRIGIPVILDLVDRQVIWTDLALRKHPVWHNAVEVNQRGMTVLGRAMTTLVKPTLYDLFTLHAEARGTRVETAADADTVFAPDQGVTPFDQAVIMADFL